MLPPYRHRYCTYRLQSLRPSIRNVAKLKCILIRRRRISLKRDNHLIPFLLPFMIALPTATSIHARMQSTRMPPAAHAALCKVVVRKQRDFWGFLFSRAAALCRTQSGCGRHENGMAVLLHASTVSRTLSQRQCRRRLPKSQGYKTSP